VQPLELDGSNRGQAVVAFDSVNAGIGDRVLLVQDGFAAFSTFGSAAFAHRCRRHWHHRPH
jgi:ethanolamine utilization protein EutN